MAFSLDIISGLTTAIIKKWTQHVITEIHQDSMLNDERGSELGLIVNTADDVDSDGAYVEESAGITTYPGGDL